MLPQEHRLRHEKEIKTLFACGKSVFGTELGLKYLRNDLKVSRFAIVVGVKVSKRAVTRNRLKRQIRAIIQLLLPETAPGYDILILTKKDALKKTYAELDNQIQLLFKKTPLL